jgi:hypothetical protein
MGLLPTATHGLVSSEIDGDPFAPSGPLLGFIKREAR